MKSYECILLLLSLLVWCSCSNGDTLATRSSGNPYEVVIVSSDSVATHLVRECLEQPVAGLPQEEPLFDVLFEGPTPNPSLTPNPSPQGRGIIKALGGESRGRGSRTENQYSDFRSIVKVVLTGNEQTAVSMHYERNVNAQPQIVVTLTAGSQEQLRRERHRWDASLRQLLSRFEMNAAKAFLRQHYNKQASDSIGKLFGVKVLVPADMQSSRYEKDFVWLSNNSATGMQNICVFEGDNIDSMVTQHIKGETDAMHMRIIEGRGSRVEPMEQREQTKACFLSAESRQRKTQSQRKTKGQSPGEVITRGLWEMTGDAMGGPFVAHIHTDSLTGRHVTVLAFVYAPESRKRNIIRKLESAIQ